MYIYIYKTHAGKPLWRSLFNEITGIKSRPTNLLKNVFSAS